MQSVCRLALNRAKDVTQQHTHGTLEARDCPADISSDFCHKTYNKPSDSMQTKTRASALCTVALCLFTFCRLALNRAKNVAQQHQHGTLEARDCPADISSHLWHKLHNTPLDPT